MNLCYHFAKNNSIFTATARIIVCILHDSDNRFLKHNSFLTRSKISGGSRGREGRPPGPKFFQFHAVFGKIWQDRMLAPPLLGSWRPILGEILDPPLKMVIKISGSLPPPRKSLTNVLGVSFFDFLCFGEFIKLRITVCLSRDALPLFLLRGDVLSVVLSWWRTF